MNVTATGDDWQNHCDATTGWLSYLAIAGWVLALLSEGLGACPHGPDGLLDALGQGVRLAYVAQFQHRGPTPRACVQDRDLPL